jgi:hypothetical protein
MGDRHFTVVSHAGHDGRAHPAKLGVLAHRFENARVGHAQRGHQAIGGAGVVLVVGVRPGAVVLFRVDDEFRDGFDGDAGGDLAGGVPAHPISDQKQLRLISDEERVLVVLALPSDVCEAVCLHVHSHSALFEKGKPLSTFLGLASLPQFGQCRTDFNIVGVPL